MALRGGLTGRGADRAAPRREWIRTWRRLFRRRWQRPRARDRRAAQRNFRRSRAGDAAPRHRRLEVDRVRDGGRIGCDGADVQQRAARRGGIPGNAARAIASVARPGGQSCAGLASGWGDFMTNGFASVLEPLSRQRGVRASLVVSETDGLIVDASLRFGQDGDRVAALAASLYRKARLSAAAARLGDVAFFQLDAEDGRIC